jgi:hypothetical protein
MPSPCSSASRETREIRQSHPRRHRTGQGLAQRSQPAPAGGACSAWPTAESTYVISGNGDVIEPEHDLIAIGSGGGFAQAAALAFMQASELSARDIVERSLNIAADICILHQSQSDHRGTVAPHVADDPARNRRGTRQAHRRPEGGQARGGDRLRNRWRRQQVAESLRQEITPKNILMIGPTGVGKTEIARRLARLAKARSSRSRPPNSPKWAMLAAKLIRSSAILSRSPSK